MFDARSLLMEVTQTMLVLLCFAIATILAVVNVVHPFPSAVSIVLAFIAAGLALQAWSGA